MSEQERVEEIATAFHGRYELLAPSFGYTTREASAVPWEDVPEQNRKLMIAVVEWLIETRVIFSPSVLSALAERIEKSAERATTRGEADAHALDAFRVRSLIEEKP